MHAVVEVVVALISALAVAVMAQITGLAHSSSKHADHHPAKAEQVVARSPRDKPAGTPKSTVDCPESRAAAA
jgi:hypothetical protein